MQHNYVIDLKRLMIGHQERHGIPRLTLRDVEIGSNLSYVTLQKISVDGTSWSRRAVNSLCDFFQRPVEEILTNVERDDY